MPAGQRAAGTGQPKGRETAHRLAVPLFVLAALAGTLWAYSTSFRGLFVYDDRPAIVDNPHIRTLWPLAEAMRAPAESPVSGRPVVSLTLALNYALAPADARDVMTPALPGRPHEADPRFYRNAFGYHAFNLTVHLLAGLLLFGVVRRTLRSARLDDRFGSAATGLAAVVSLVWLVHPLNTQAVTYVVRRIDLLMGLFALLTLYCAIRAAADGPRRRWWEMASIGACTLGMGTKEAMVGVPIVVWLWDRTFGVDTSRRRALYLGLVATWGLLALLVATELRPQSVGFGHGWTWWEYLRTQAGVIVHYLRLSVVPWPLVFDYGWPKATSVAAVAPQVLAVGGLVALSAFAIARRHPAGFAGAWLFILLAPTSSLLPIVTEVAAEHRMYLPLAGLLTVLVTGGFEVARYLTARGVEVDRARPGPRAWVVGACVAAAVVCAGFAETSRARNRVYWSDEALWLDTLQKRPANPQARIGYAITLLAAQRWTEAESHLRIALEIEPGNGRAHMNLGSALAAQGRVDDGIRHLEQALRLAPHIPETFGLLAQAYQDQRRYAEAAVMYRRAVEVMPDNAFVLNSFAWLLATAPDAGVRDGAEAVGLARRALAALGSRPALFLATLAAALAEDGRMPQAVEVAREGVARALAEGDQATASDLRRQLSGYHAGLPTRIR